jgi:3-oxoacyl-[acyl-carrier protein] reductase
MRADWPARKRSIEEDGVELTFPVAAGATAPVAIVTGVSRRNGIGAAIVRRLAASGVQMFATGWSRFDGTLETGVDPDGPESLLAEIADAGGTAIWFESDLMDITTPARLFDEAERQLGPVSILINNAAYSKNAAWDEIDAEILDNHYRVNVRGTTLMTVEFARRYQRGTGGRVISLTSGQFKGPMLNEVPYASSKGAVDAFTISMAAELAPLGITVNTVGPGPTDTGWMTPELAAELLPKHPLGRLGAPDDIARLITFLASEQAEWITGQIIHTEGGFLRR